MFNMGFSELVLLGIIALIVIGPKQLPEVARVVASLLNDLRRATSDLRDSITQVKHDVDRSVRDFEFNNNPEDWVKGQAKKVLEEREKTGTLEQFETTKDLTDEAKVSKETTIEDAKIQAQDAKETTTQSEVKNIRAEETPASPEKTKKGEKS